MYFVNCILISHSRLADDVLNYHLHCHKIIANKKYVLWNAGICPIASKVGHMTLATPPFGVIHHRLYSILLPAMDLTEKTRSLWPKIEIQDGGRPPS